MTDDEYAAIGARIDEPLIVALTGGMDRQTTDEVTRLLGEAVKQIAADRRRLFDIVGRYREADRGREERERAAQQIKEWMSPRPERNPSQEDRIADHPFAKAQAREEAIENIRRAKREAEAVAMMTECVPTPPAEPCECMADSCEAPATRTMLSVDVNGVSTPRYYCEAHFTGAIIEAFGL